MDKIFISKDTPFESFVDFYISQAFTLARESPSIELFEYKLRTLTSESFGLSKTLVKKLYKPFHWVFFNNHKNSSPLEYCQATTNKKRETLLIGLN